MNCPNCGSENNDSAKFCKKCGTPLKKEMNHQNVINSANQKSGGDNTTKYVIIALIIVAIVLAGAFVYIYGFGSHDDSSSQKPVETNQQSVDQDDDNDEPVQAQSTQSSEPKSQISIKGGSFTTGSADEDKTYARINVGSEHAGEDVVVQIWYSRDGNTLNHGNMVPASVHSDGYLEIASADAYLYYPDYATINIYDNSGNLLDTQSVSLGAHSGTQTF